MKKFKIILLSVIILYSASASSNIIVFSDKKSGANYNITLSDKGANVSAKKKGVFARYKLNIKQLLQKILNTNSNE